MIADINIRHAKVMGALEFFADIHDQPETSLQSIADMTGNIVDRIFFLHCELQRAEEYVTDYYKFLADVEEPEVSLIEREGQAPAEGSLSDIPSCEATSDNPEISVADIVLPIKKRKRGRTDTDNQH